MNRESADVAGPSKFRRILSKFLLVYALGVACQIDYDVTINQSEPEILLINPFTYAATPIEAGFEAVTNDRSSSPAEAVITVSNFELI